MFIPILFPAEIARPTVGATGNNFRSQSIFPRPQKFRDAVHQGADGAARLDGRVHGHIATGAVC